MQFQGNTCGLCGNLNDNQNDDFLTPQNLPETLPSDFGDSWKVEPSCADAHVIEHPCKTNKHRAAWAYKTCNIIRRDVFQPCHDKVSKNARNKKNYLHAYFTMMQFSSIGPNCEQVRNDGRGVGQSTPPPNFDTLLWKNKTLRKFIWICQ